jgi:hypothetical protein
MKKLLIAIGFCLFGVAPRAHAGTRVSSSVVVNQNPDFSGEASGSLGSARNSTDLWQYIGCDLSAYAGGGLLVNCYARTASATGAGCSSHDPSLVQSVFALNSDSYLDFKWNASGDCTFIRAETYSSNETKR